MDHTETHSVENQTLNNKNNSILIIVLIILSLLIFGGGYYFFFMRGETVTTDSKLSTNISNLDLATTNIYAVDDDYSLVANGDTLWMYGYYEMNFSGEVLTNTDDESDYMMMLDTSNLSEIGVSANQLVIVRGTYDSENYVLVVDEITPLEETDIDVINSYKYPKAKIEILDYPTNLAHGCDRATFLIKLTNTGHKEIVHSDFYTKSTTLAKFNFVQVINGQDDIGYSIDYNTGEMVDGFEEFEPIKPGESKTLRFGGGGSVSKGCTEDGLVCGRSGSPNIFCGSSTNPAGDNTFQLKIGYLKPGSYTERNYTSESNVVNVNVASCECNLD